MSVRTDFRTCFRGFSTLKGAELPKTGTRFLSGLRPSRSRMPLSSSRANERPVPLAFCTICLESNDQYLCSTYVLYQIIFLNVYRRIWNDEIEV